LILEAIEGAMGGILGVAAERDGNTCFYNADLFFPTASCIKIAIVEEIFQQNLDQTKTILVSSEDIIAGSGILSTLTTPIGLPLTDLATLALSVSDNTASNLCLQAVGGPDAINSRLRSWGIENTTIHRPIKFRLEPDDPPYTATTTPSDFLQILQKISEGTKAKMALCASDDLIPRYLAINPFARELGVPTPPITVLHKTGAVEGVRNDVGYIRSEKPELTIAIFTRNVPDGRWTPENAGCITVGRIAEYLYESLG
jgi:beta-lactamase class A